MILKGDRIPDIELRTDEGTPLSLNDLKGRSMAVFMLGEALTKTTREILSVLGENAGRFLAVDTSPVVVSGEPVETLAAFRSKKNVPYLLISDNNLNLHRCLGGKDKEGCGVWIVDNEGFVKDTLPLLPAVELIRLAAERASRSSRAGRRRQDIS